MEKIRVIITNSQKEVKIPTGMRMLVRRCCNAVLRMEGFPYSAEISVTFVDNKEIRKLNAEYRNKDIETDVLSFPMGENGQYDENHATGAKIWGMWSFPSPKPWNRPSCMATASSGKSGT